MARRATRGAMILLGTVLLALLPVAPATPSLTLHAPFHGHLYHGWSYSLQCGHLTFPSKFAFNKSSGVESEAVKVGASTVGCRPLSALAEWSHVSTFVAKPVSVGAGHHSLGALWNITGHVALASAGTGNHSKRSTASAAAEAWVGIASLAVCVANPNGSPSMNCTVVCATPGSAFPACWSVTWNVSSRGSGSATFRSPFQFTTLSLGNVTTNASVRWDIETSVYFGVDAWAIRANETASASLDLAGAGGGLRLVTLSVS